MPETSDEKTSGMTTIFSSVRNSVAMPSIAPPRAVSRNSRFSSAWIAFIRAAASAAS